MDPTEGEDTSSTEDNKGSGLEPEGEGPPNTPSEKELEELVRAEQKQFEDNAQQDSSGVAALLRYIDSDLANPDFEMPYFTDAHGSLTYLAGVVQLRRNAQDTRHRQHLIRNVTSFASVWILAVLTIVALDGAGVLTLPTGALVVLLGTTTANVLGLLVIVLRGMFDGKPLDYVRHLEAIQDPDSEGQKSGD